MCIKILLKKCYKVKNFIVTHMDISFRNNCDVINLEITLDKTFAYTKSFFVVIKNKY